MDATDQNQDLTGERAALVATLDRQRGFLLQTAHGLTEEQARTASTFSSLTIASLLKHVADTEEQWFRFAVEGGSALAPDGDQPDWSAIDEQDAWADTEWVDTRFVLTDHETLDHLRARIEEVVARTTEILRSADLETAHALPAAPCFEPGASWSVRRVAIHMLSEISEHSGHADIIREAVDGARTMGCPVRSRTSRSGRGFRPRWRLPGRRPAA